MILRIVLLLSCGVLVSSNNGYPIIPAQTYPNYQQNGYANPPANQPSDIASYLQAMMVQNQSPSLNLSPSDIKQILLNKLLSGHQMQTNFDRTPMKYGPNFGELPNNPIAPNAVNSYFAAPVNEYVLNQQMGANKENKADVIKIDESRKKTKKKKTKSRRKHNESTRRHKSELDKDNDLDDNDREVSKKPKKRSRKPKTEVLSHENHSNNENNKKTKKKKRKTKENEVKNPVEEEDMVEDPKPRRRHKKKPKSDKNNEEIVPLEQPTTLKSAQIQESINLAHFNEGIVEENRIPRNPIPESNDLFKSIPNLPENFANNFNFNGLSQFNNPAMSHFFANYENIYQSMMSNNKGINEQREIKKTKRPQNSRNNKPKPKIVVKNKNSTATTVPKKTKPAVTPKVNVVTTEKPIPIKEKPPANVDPIPKKESPKSIEKPPEEKETIHELKNEEVKDMETNINDPFPDSGYIEDYYPQFTDSAAYTANNREVIIKNLSDTKYYYAVDKQNPELISRRRFEGLVLPERMVKDYELNKKYDDAEDNTKTTTKPDFKETKENIIQFRTPPKLELPDFQTRKVDRSEINPDSYYLFDEIDEYDARFLPDKASIYSEVKIPHYTGRKDSNKKVIKDKNKDVETVFARSKVATYGPVYNPEEDSASAANSNQELTDDSSFKDGGTTFVLAKSVDYPESFW